MHQVREKYFLIFISANSPAKLFAYSPTQGGKANQPSKPRSVQTYKLRIPRVSHPKFVDVYKVRLLYLLVRPFEQSRVG
jgi:hypothetical protein